ncbi:dimethylsulfonioproprionate lyase family protein [Aestuariivirga sp.]|uniref:dimethylsulfonioproprionate lyase family protein n=1 Tax=Aestuariivirga sp. TaxID=2650926 RepID=UPI0039196510
MTARDLNLQLVLDLSRDAILGGAGERPAAAARRVFERLAARTGVSGAVEAGRLPVCHHHLDAAYAGMAALPSPMPELASAFAAVEARLRWTKRKGVSPQDQPFESGHANTTLIGRGGIEERDDVWVGATVMAPGITYPDHHHPPEEIYLAFTPGEWWNAEMDWKEPGPGGVIYNPPGILHAMRSGGSPFLAMWFLPVD